MAEGKFIVFEGIDGSGKTTQIQAIAKWLDSLGQAVLITREPGATKLGAYLRDILTGGYENIDIYPEIELFLFAADRVQHVKEVIVPALAEGKIVLCDRYSVSTMAYQGYGRGISKGLVSQVNRLSTTGLAPDLTVYLDLDVETALNRIASRGSKDRFDKEDIAFFQRVRTGYLEWFGWSLKVATIRAKQSTDVVTQEIIHAIKERFHESQYR